MSCIQYIGKSDKRLVYNLGLYVSTFSSAPRPPTSLLFGGVTNTSLEVTWSGPTDSDYDNFDLQWTPQDNLSVINPYQTRTSGSRIDPEGDAPGSTLQLQPQNGQRGHGTRQRDHLQPEHSRGHPDQ